MELTAWVKKSGDWWIADVPDLPGLFARTCRLNDIVDALAADYEHHHGLLPEPFLVALKVDAESWRMYRPHWPVESRWNEAWQLAPYASEQFEREVRDWLEIRRDDT